MIFIKYGKWALLSNLENSKMEKYNNIRVGSRYQNLRDIADICNAPLHPPARRPTKPRWRNNQTVKPTSPALQARSAGRCASGCWARSYTLSCTFLKQTIPIHQIKSQGRDPSVNPRKQSIAYSLRIVSIARQLFL